MPFICVSSQRTQAGYMSLDRHVVANTFNESVLEWVIFVYSLHVHHLEALRRMLHQSICYFRRLFFRWCHLFYSSLSVSRSQMQSTWDLETTQKNPLSLMEEYSQCSGAAFQETIVANHRETMLIPEPHMLSLPSLTSSKAEASISIHPWAVNVQTIQLNQSD